MRDGIMILKENLQNSHDIVKKHVVIIMHSVLNLKFFWIPIITEISKYLNVTVYIKNDYPDILKSISLQCDIKFIPIERNISIFSDIISTLVIYKNLRHDSPDLLQTITPKAGLLGMLAGTAARVPIRIHTFQGQVWANATGFRRWMLRSIDRLVANLATKTLSDSQTQCEFLRKERVLKADGGQVLGSGSISGVDLTKFDRNLPVDLGLQRELGLTGDEFVFLYIGRLQRDKGIHVLADAYATLLTRVSRPVRLVVVGPDEDDLGPLLMNKLGASVTVRPYTDRPEAYLRLANVTVLPSFREGFGSVLIEAAAMGVPAIASRIYGIDCAVVDGETGLLFESGNAEEMEACMMRLLDDPVLLQNLSEAAMLRAVREFDQRIVVAKLVAYYLDALNEKRANA